MSAHREWCDQWGRNCTCGAAAPATSDALRAAAEQWRDRLGFPTRMGDGETVQYAMMARSLLEAIDAATTPSAPAEAPLDAAWAVVEAALPQGWRIDACFIHDTLAGPEWEAEAWRDGQVMAGNGPTPAAALRSLATALRAQQAEPRPERKRP